MLKWFSEAVKLFHDDLTGHGLADDVLMMQWSEFGRRPGENASYGTDHGTAAPIFVMGNPVRGGLYGDQPYNVLAVARDLHKVVIKNGIVSSHNHARQTDSTTWQSSALAKVRRRGGRSLY